MASTNKTPRLGLSQWVLSDPFRMEDFNQDNARLDALAFEKIGEVVTTQDCQQVDLDVSGIEWDRYAAVTIFWQPKVRRLSSDCAMLQLRANNRAAADDYLRRWLDSNGGAGEKAGCLYSTGIANGAYWKGNPVFETSVCPQFNDSGAVFLTRNCGFYGNTTFVSGILTSSTGSVTAVALKNVKSLNVYCYNNDSALTTLTLLAGSRFSIYGVRI